MCATLSCTIKMCLLLSYRWFMSLAKKVHVYFMCSAVS